MKHDSISVHERQKTIAHSLRPPARRQRTGREAPPIGREGSIPRLAASGRWKRVGKAEVGEVAPQLRERRLTRVGHGLWGVQVLVPALELSPARSPAAPPLRRLGSCGPDRRARRATGDAEHPQTASAPASVTRRLFRQGGGRAAAERRQQRRQQRREPGNRAARTAFGHTRVTQRGATTTS